MSTDYIPREKIAGTDSFHVNRAGRRLLFKISVEAGIPSNTTQGCVESSMSPDKAKKSAAKIAELADSHWLAKHNPTDFAGTPEQFVAFVRRWQSFLEQCGGYKEL